MLFNSLAFLVFAPLFFAVYFVLKGRARMIFVLLSSYFFYGWWDWRFLGLLILSTVIDYYLGIGIENAGADHPLRKRLLILSMVSNLAILCFFKYLNFFIDSAYQILGAFGYTDTGPILRIVLPIGISFYTFQSMSYIIDLYRGKLRAERDFIRYAAFVALFPQLVAGPIQRASDMLPQLLHDHRVDWSRIARGLELMLWGFFLKLCLADTAATVVDLRFEAPDRYGALAHMIGVLCFALQIYGDFAGYSLIAIGLGKAMGFDFGINFNRPYFARSFSDFWVRWHISLSTWLRDYLYISLGGNRRGRLVTIRNLVITMFLGGLWHGAAQKFIVWGLLHGTYLVLQRLLGPIWNRMTNALRVPGAAVAVIEISLVFSLTCFAWIFFRASTLEDAVRIIGVIASFDDMSLHMSEQLIGIAKTGMAAVAVTAVDIVGQSKRVRDRYWNSTVARVLGALVLIWSIILLGTFQGTSFLYFQF